MAAAHPSELSRLDAAARALESTLVVRDGRAVGRRNPTRPGALAGLGLAGVEVALMLTVGGSDVAGYPLAERLLAWTLASSAVAAVIGAGLLLCRRFRHRALAALSVTLAAFLAAVLVLVGHGIGLPLHLEELLSDGAVRAS